MRVGLGPCLDCRTHRKKQVRYIRVTCCKDTGTQTYTLRELLVEWEVKTGSHLAQVGLPLLSECWIIGIKAY